VRPSTRWQDPHGNLNAPDGWNKETSTYRRLSNAKVSKKVKGTISKLRV